MAAIDAFSSDAFSMTSLTTAINKLPYAPRLLGMLNLFTPQPIRTTTAFVEERRGKLALLKTAARGTVGNVRSKDTRYATPLNVPHVPYHQTILAEDIQNLRAFGSETELQALASYVNDQLGAMKQDHEVTWEWHRLGALKGQILDADGATTLYNLFTEFGVTQVEEDWNFENSNFEVLCTTIIRQIADQLGGTPYGQIYAICGNDYFDSVVQHSSVRTAYDRWREGEMLRVSNLGPEWYSVASNGLMFQNIMFINYRGGIGDLDFMTSTEAYYFASGVPGLFVAAQAPANFMETVNTLGKPLYAKQEAMKWNMGVELHTQSNVLYFCTRPSSVIKSTVCNFTGTGTGCD